MVKYKLCLPLLDVATFLLFLREALFRNISFGRSVESLLPTKYKEVLIKLIVRKILLNLVLLINLLP